MYISNLSIRNFRNFRNISIPFYKGVNTLIGENGSGKTNLFHAIRLMVDENMPRTINFHETDFNRSIGGWKGHWIIIRIEFKDLGPEEDFQLIHKIGAMNNPNEGTYSLYFRPKEIIRNELYKLSKSKDKNQEKLRAILDGISINDYESVFLAKGNGDFSIDEIYNEYVGDFDKIIFPNPDDKKTDIYGVEMNSFNIVNEFTCTFAKALRDVESDLRSYRNNPLINLLRDNEKSISIDNKKEIEDEIEILNKRISELKEVTDVSQGISKSIKKAVGETYAPNISIKSELPSEMEKLLKSLKLWVGDSDDEEYQGRLWELSLGGANLIYISLKLLEFEIIKKRCINFIIIEEPEAHIHTHIQKTLFQKIDTNRLNTQIFISTHSTHISSVSAINSMNILAKKGNLSEIYTPARGLNSTDIRKLERYLDASRTNLLFAKGIILVEGDAEQILIPELIKKNFDLSLDELGISIINIGSTGFENIAQIFNTDRVRRKCSIITDSDSAFIKLPENYDDDIPYERHIRLSEGLGIKRRKHLNELYNDNPYVKAFYANYTFEIDFLCSDNVDSVTQVVDDEYKDGKTIQKIKDKLSNEDVSICGKEVLRLANKFKKGWFAMMISDKITHQSRIPKYILEAISYVCPRISKTLLFSIAEFRLNSYVNCSDDSQRKCYVSLREKFNDYESKEDALSFFKESLPDDILSQLIVLLDAK